MKGNKMFPTVLIKAGSSFLSTTCIRSMTALGWRALLERCLAQSLTLTDKYSLASRLLTYIIIYFLNFNWFCLFVCSFVWQHWNWIWNLCILKKKKTKHCPLAIHISLWHFKLFFVLSMYVYTLVCVSHCVSAFLCMHYEWRFFQSPGKRQGSFVASVIGDFYLPHWESHALEEQ